MELLFDKNGKGNEEIQELLGFLDIDIPFKKLKSKVITATNNVKYIIGKEMYDLALAEYKKDEGKIDKDLIYYVRLPIAIQAYSKFAPHNDVSHTNKGRLNRVEQNEKTAFEWTVDKDDKALVRSYYEELDSLIKYLDEHIESWKTTSAYEKTHTMFFRTADEFEEFFPINESRLILMKLAPGIKQAEKREIKPRLSDGIYNTLKLKSKTNAEDINEELLYEIKRACAYKSLAWAMRRLSVQLFPEGVLQGFVSERMTINAKKPSEDNGPATAAYYFELDAKEALLEIETIVAKLKDATIVIKPMVHNPNNNNKFLST